MARHEGSDSRLRESGHVKVLLVEDTVELAQLVQLVLEDVGWQIDLAYDGATALAMASTAHQLALVDLGLPDMSGAELVDALRSNPALEQLPVIWFTAFQDGPPPSSGLGVIKKPFDPGTLAGDIAALLS
jgi:DNA-binding response OmpR family regulator